MLERRLFLLLWFSLMVGELVSFTHFNSDDAIVWLLSGDPKGDKEDVLETQFLHLESSVNSVVQNLLTPFKKTSAEVSLLIFHAHINFSSTIKTTNWETKLRGIDAAIKFVDVSNHPSFQTPEWRASDPPNAKYGKCGYEKWPEQELFLNAFRLNGLIEHEALDQFEYVLQLGSDTYIEKTMPFDPFKKIRELNGTYAYHECSLEPAVECVEGIPEAIGRFVRKHGITPEHLSELNPRTIYRNTFGLFKMSDWRNPQLRLLSQTLVVREQGVHRDAWKDQNIIPLLLGVFVKKEQVIRWPKLFYEKIIVDHPMRVKKRPAGGEGAVLSKKENVMCKHDFGCVCSSDQERVIHLWDAILSPHRSAVVTYALDNRVVSGIRVLYHSLLNTGSLESSVFIVLDFGLPWQSRNLLRSEGILVDFSHANKNLTTSHTFNETRYKDVQWRMFTKLNVFGFGYLDRVVYLDADTFVLRSIAHLLDKSVTKAVAATPELPEHAPEFNGGTIVLDPSEELFDDMVHHLNDTKYKCGIRAEDQSFLCHYFYGKWTSLGPFFQLHYWNFKWRPDLLNESYVMHFIYCPKPWDDDAIDDEFFGKWNDVAATLHPPASVNSQEEWSFL